MILEKSLVVIVILFFLLSLSAEAEECKIVNGYGTSIGQGKDHREALKNARIACGTMIIDLYIKERGSIPEEMVGELAVVCVNYECEGK
jgi:hypothetical protein